jgi:crossover junction endodeoxyribonuclease RusA
MNMVLTITPPDARRRDSDNFVAHVLKPIKDGIVDAGVIPDDTDEYVTWSLRLADPSHDRLKRWRYRLTVEAA